MLDDNPVPKSKLEEWVSNIPVCEVLGNAVTPDPIEVGRLPSLPDEDGTTIEAGVL
jgi:hypothetical protein